MSAPSQEQEEALLTNKQRQAALDEEHKQHEVSTYGRAFLEPSSQFPGGGGRGGLLAIVLPPAHAVHA